MAGLAAAHRLANASVDFMVIEASHRIGGRVLTDYSLGRSFPLELGALMIHGKRVVTHSWVQELGLHARRLPIIQRARFSLDGKILSFPSFTHPFHTAYGLRALYQGVYGIRRALRRYSGPDLSLADFLNGTKARRGAQQLAKLLYAHAAGAEPQDVGVKGHAEEDRMAHEEFGYSNYQLVEGYSELVRKRAVSFEDRIRLGTSVTAIRYSHRGVRIQATKYDGGEEVEFRARRAIVSLPLGVLKAGDVEFDPPLPEEKRRAIDAVGFGDTLVVNLHLRGGNLLQKTGDFGILWGEGASSFHRLFVGLSTKVNVLTAFTVGREAHRRSELEDKEIVAATVAELEDILPRGVQPGEVKVLSIGKWPSDTLFRGGYSYLPPNAGVIHRKALASPVDGVLFFSGEATHTTGESATVHGAIETGVMAAEDAIRSLQG